MHKHTRPIKLILHDLLMSVLLLNTYTSKYDEEFMNYEKLPLTVHLGINLLLLFEPQSDS